MAGFFGLVPESFQNASAAMNAMRESGDQAGFDAYNRLLDDITRVAQLSIGDAVKILDGQKKYWVQDFDAHVMPEENFLSLNFRRLEILFSYAQNYDHQVKVLELLDAEKKEWTDRMRTKLVSPDSVGRILERIYDYNVRLGKI